MCTVHPGRNDQIKDDEMGGACGTYGREEQHMQGFGGKTWRECLEHLGVDAKPITLTSQKYVRWVKSKVKCTLVQALMLCTGPTAHRGSRGIALLFLDHGTRRGEGSSSRPVRSLPPGKTRYPLCRRLGGPQGRSGQVRKILPPPGFHPRTVQSVASRYTDYATRLAIYDGRVSITSRAQDRDKWRALANPVMSPGVP